MKTDVAVSIWISDEDAVRYWLEGEKATARVEVTDADEIRLGVGLPDLESEVVGLYLSRAEADRLSRFLAAAVAAPVDMKAITGA